MRDEFHEVCEAEFSSRIVVQIDPKLAELHGYLDGQIGSSNLFEDIQIVLRHSFGFASVGNIFTKPRNEARYAVARKNSRCGKSVFHIFSGDKSPDAASHKAIAWSLLSQPRILRSPP
jgi:hypothetical protein